MSQLLCTACTFMLERKWLSNTSYAYKVCVQRNMSLSNNTATRLQVACTLNAGVLIMGTYSLLCTVLAESSGLLQDWRVGCMAVPVRPR